MVAGRRRFNERLSAVVSKVNDFSDHPRIRSNCRTHFHFNYTELCQTEAGSFKIGLICWIDTITRIKAGRERLTTDVIRLYISVWLVFLFQVLTALVLMVRVQKTL